MKSPLVLSLASLLACAASFAQQARDDVPQVGAARIDEEIEFDGLINEAFWNSIEPATNFIQQNPDEGAPSTERTEVRIAYDDANLYFGIIC